jgi:hypothetical protein
MYKALGVYKGRIRYKGIVVAEIHPQKLVHKKKAKQKKTGITI